MFKLNRLLGPVAALALVGCAAPDGAYPSLGVRDTERVSGTMAAPVPQIYEPVPADAANLALGDQLVARANSAHLAFLDTAPAARSVVNAAQGASRDSENWVRAQVAIADLEASRAQVMIALADLDRLTIDAAVEGAQFASLAQKRDEIASLASNQTQTINTLLQSLAR